MVMMLQEGLQGRGWLDLPQLLALLSSSGESPYVHRTGAVYHELPSHMRACMSSQSTHTAEQHDVRKG